MASTDICDKSAKEGRTFHEYFTSNKTVEIYVGPERKLYFFNEDFLCDRVPFFRGAFKTAVKEGQSKSIELPEDDGESFGHLITWIYTSDLNCKWCDNTYDNPLDPNDLPHELQWLRVWVLADKLNLAGLAQKALIMHKECMDRHELSLSPDAVTFACKHSAEDSALRKRLVDEALVAIFTEMRYYDNDMEAATVDASFNKEVMRAIKWHAMIPDDLKAKAFTWDDD